MDWNISGFVQGVSHYVCFCEVVAGIQRDDSSDYEGTWEGGSLDFKELERNQVFFVYISRTYRATVPYLKGIH